MKKNVVLLIILVAVLVLLTVGTVVLLNLKNGEEGSSSGVVSSEAASSAVKYTLFDFEKTDVKSVRIQNPSGDFTLVRSSDEAGSAYVLKGTEKVALNPSVASQSTNYIGSLTSLKLVSEDKTALSTYGLDAPQTTVTATLYDGTEYVLYIGSETPNGGYYINTSLSEDVYLLNAYTAQYYFHARTDYYPQDLMPSVTTDNYIGLLLIRPKSHNVEMIRLSDDEYEEASKNAVIKSQYELKQPFSYDANTVYIQKLVTAVTDLTATKTVTDDVSDASLAKYGLDNPMKLTIHTGSSSATILIGDLNTAENVYYVMSEGRDVVYTASAEALFFVADGADKYAYTMVGLVALKQINCLEIVSGEKKWEFICTDTDDNDKLAVVCGTTEIPPKEFSKLYQQIFSATQNGLAEKPAGEPYLRISYKLIAGGEVVLEYYKIDSTRYFVSQNGWGVFSVKADMVEKIVADCERIMNGEIISVV